VRSTSCDVNQLASLAVTVAQKKIRAYLVSEAIEDTLGENKFLPNMESQIMQLYRHETAIAKFRTEKRMVEKQKEPSMSFSP
jgi:hypothetical protein